jgi:hypothetical protein
MNGDRTALQGASEGSACLNSTCLERIEDDFVHWLTPQGMEEFPRGRSRSRAWLTRLTATVGVGVLLNVGSSETAIAPAAVAHSASTQVKDPVLEAALPPVDAPSPLPAELAPPPRQAAAPGVQEVVAARADVKASFDLDLGGLMPGAKVRAEAAARPAAQPAAEPEEIIHFGNMRVPRSIVETILQASAVTGVDPVYMMALADKESSFSTRVKASTSSAEGLFQFISSTWLQVIREHGPKHGLAAEAGLIEVVKGQLQVADDADRERILALRRNPYVSALMAAEMLKRDRAKIQQRIGRDLTRSEFYLAHFLGVDGAGRFMEILDEKPKQPAPKHFARAAKANKTLFFAKAGKKTRGLTVAEVYNKIDSMIDKRLGRYERVAYLNGSDDFQTAVRD